MKKTILYIAILILVILITSGSTYAFLTATIASNVGTSTNASKLDVIYTGGTELKGGLNLSTSKEGGYNTTVRIKLAEDSVDAKANLYIQIEEITSAIATEAFVWEVYKKYDGVETFVDSGTFLECENGESTKKCSNGDRLYIVKDYVLTTTDTYYTIYLWLNGDKVGNEALNAVLEGYISAETEIITTEIG